MKFDLLLFLLVFPSVALAGSGGAIVIIFFPLLLWILIKIWKIWFRFIFSDFSKNAPKTSSVLLNDESTKICPHCAESVLLKARKCKHCSSDIS